MALNALYQVRARQQWGGTNKPLENVFFFNRTTGGSGSADLAIAFGAAIGGKINALQTNTVHNYSIDIINLGDPEDFVSLPWVGVGNYDGEALPPYAAVGYTMKLSTRAVRHGSKRISGVPETVGSNGKVTDVTYQAAMEALRIALKDALTDGDTTWVPVVVKRIKTAIAGTVPQQYKYRLPAAGDPLVLGEVVVVLTSNDLSHQVSREV